MVEADDGGDERDLGCCAVLGEPWLTWKTDEKESLVLPVVCNTRDGVGPTNALLGQTTNSRMDKNGNMDVVPMVVVVAAAPLLLGPATIVVTIVVLRDTVSTCVSSSDCPATTTTTRE